jgi:hypothetical protein
MADRGLSLQFRQERLCRGALIAFFHREQLRQTFWRYGESMKKSKGYGKGKGDKK